MSRVDRHLKVLNCELPCHNMLESCIFLNSKVDPVRGMDVQSYETRGREDCQTGRHRTAAFEPCLHRQESICIQPTEFGKMFHFLSA